METYSKQHINIGSDLYIELHHNSNLNNKPFMLKVFSYEGYTEHRLDRSELLNLSEVLADFAFDKTNDNKYDDDYTGLARLWHNRRNEALDELDQLQTKLEDLENKYDKALSHHQDR